MAIKPKSALLQVRIDPDVLAAFHELAEGCRTTASALLRSWVYATLDQQKKRVERLEKGLPEHQQFARSGRPVDAVEQKQMDSHLKQQVRNKRKAEARRR